MLTKAEKDKLYYQRHRDEIKKRSQEYKQSHPEERKKYSKEYYQKHREQDLDYRKNTKTGRAGNLMTAYRQEDKKYGRGQCTLTTKWIVENIFNKRCMYCGEEDWRLLGADRIYNDKPHTPENCVPCCYSCNCKRWQKGFIEFALQRIGAKESEGLVIG